MAIAIGGSVCFIHGKHKHNLSLCTLTEGVVDETAVILKQLFGNRVEDERGCTDVSQISGGE